MPDQEKIVGSTGGLSLPDMKDRVQDAMLLSGAAMFICYPMFYYQYSHLTAEIFSRPPTIEQLKMLAMGQSLMLFGAAILCALVGLLYCEKLFLPGLGKVSDFWVWLLPAAALGLLVTPAAYLLADRTLLGRIPEAFPKPWPWALSWMAGSAISQEVVARLGLLTIGVYLLRWRDFRGHPWPAIAAVSVFASACAFIFLERIEFTARLETWQIITSMAGIFIFQWMLSEVFVRRGFMAVLALHFGLGARLVVYALMGT